MVTLRDRDLAELLLGGSGNDTIEGGGGRDTINGGTGDDRLVGGAGVDALTGGPGADRFVLVPTSFTGLPPDTGRGEGNRDVVTDSRSGEDLLDLSGYHGAPNLRWEAVGVRRGRGPAHRDLLRPAQIRFPELEIELGGVRHLNAAGIVV